MGVIVNLYRKSGGKIDLGKPRHLLQFVSTPGLEDVWKIMSMDGMYHSFTLGPDDRNRLTAGLRGLMWIDDENVFKIADKIIEWGKGTELLIIPDNDDETDILVRFGFRKRNKEHNIWI